MSRKDYVAVAMMLAMLRNLGYDVSTLERVADEFATIAGRDNPRFDRSRFITATRTEV